MTLGPFKVKFLLVDYLKVFINKIFKRIHLQQCVIPDL